MEIHEPKVAILDAGAQYVDLIKKACERLGFPAHIYPLDTSFKKLPKSVEAIIVSGGPSSSHVDGAPMPDTQIWEQSKIPTFNICYGMQAFALHSGGSVSTRPYRSDSRQTTNLVVEHPLFHNIREQTQALFTHGDFVDTVGENVTIIGQHRSQYGDQIVSAIAKGNHVCVQFHPEVSDDTPQGLEMFDNFFIRIAGLKPVQEFLDNRMHALVQEKQNQIKARVGDKHVIAFVSGGVDSVVAVMLAKDVIPANRLHMYYVNNGYMRNEDDSVIETLKNINLDVHTVDAEKDFEQATAMIDGVKIGPLIDTINPIHKRRIIGEKFVDIQDDILKELGFTQDQVVLLQGTNAADRIESGHSKAGGGTTDQIKEHHNQVKRVRDLNPLEPIDDLFKEEIRQLATHLGLPDHIAYRQPFPGPGLAIRILGLDATAVEDTSQKLQAKIDTAISDINRTSKASLTARLLPVRSVGVGGDARSHVQAVALEGPVEFTELASISSSLTSEFRGTLNRVVYKLSGPSLKEISPTETKLTRDMRHTLKAADAIAMQVAREMHVLRSIEQFPVILLPLGAPGMRSIVLRPLMTRSHLTVQALLPEVDLPLKFFEVIAERIISEVEGISHVFTDLTNKPPGTTEWE